MSVNNIVRYPAKQGSFSATQTLCDVEIPSGSGVWDLSKCYVEIPVRPTFTETTTGALVGQPAGQSNVGVYSASLIVDVDGNSAGKSLACPPSSAILVKNAECFSSAKGRIASARRVDCIRSALASYEKDEATQVDDPSGINFPAKDNIWAFGELAELTGDGDEKSVEHTHGIKIYLSDVFNFASMTAYDSSPSAMGALRIHLETNLDLLKASPRITAATFALSQDGDAGLPDYGAIDAYADPGGGGQAMNYAMTTAVYESVEDSPFWVGQKCLISTGGAANGATQATNVPVKIKKITLNTGVAGVLNPTSAGAAAGNKGKLFIELDTAGFVADIPDNGTLAAGTLVYSPPAATALEFNKIDLVAVSSSDSPPSGVDYTEWVLQDDSLAAGTETEYTRTYQIPPNCMSGVVLHCNAKPANGSSMYSTDDIKSYRVSINNEPLTSLAVQRQSAQHYDLIRKMFVNRGRTLKSVEEVLLSLDGRRVADARRVDDINIIAFPVPLSAQPQQLELNVVKDGGFFSGPIRIYWETIKSV